jgi:hypothetical protein
MNMTVTVGPRMVTGNGGSDTHALVISTKDGDVPNPHESAGKDYGFITGKEIAALAQRPASLPKMDAPWFIGSDYIGHDARSHEAQRANGAYHVLPVDIDEGNPSLAEVVEATTAVFGDGASFIVYSSSSATADNRKWRVLTFISPPLPGSEYKETQGAIFDLYQFQCVKCDRALDRTGQLVFLPNVPPERRGPDGAPLFYDFHLNRGALLRINDDSAIGKRRQTLRAAVGEAAQEASDRRQAARAKRLTDEDASPVEVFNERHDLQNLMAKYGYKQQGQSDHWQSPNQSSGSYAVRLFDSVTWVSLSGSDMAAAIGAVKDHCCYGDAFDLFVHYEHRGDYKAAVRAYGREINPPTVGPVHGALEMPIGDDFGPPGPAPQAATKTRPEAGPEANPDNPPAATPDDALTPEARALKEWAFLSGDNEFYHIPTGRIMGVNAFNLAMAPITGPVLIPTKDGVTEKKYPPAKTLVEYLNGTIAHSTMYRPDLQGDLHVMSGGIPFINSYMGKSVPKADPEWQAKPAWQLCERHILNILGPAGAIIIQWMAHNVRRPGVKILWAPIIVGVQGDGKTTLAKMLTAAMGTMNVGPVSPETMFSDFTGWAEGSCVKVLEEIRVHGNSRHDAMNKLKPLITNDSVEVVRKGKDGKQVKNVTNYLALTNYMDALALDEGDRRWGVFKTRFDDRAAMLAEFDKPYWDALHGAIDQEPEVIRGWLLNVPLDTFDRVAGPEITAHKQAMIQSTRTPDQIDVEEAIALGWHGVTENLLATDCLNQAIMGATAQRLNTSRMARALASAGWVALPGTVKWKGNNRRLWFKKSALLGGATAAELRAILDTSEGQNDL